MADGSNAHKRQNGTSRVQTDGHASDYNIVKFAGTEVWRYTASAFTLARTLAAAAITATTVAATGAITGASAAVTGALTGASLAVTGAMRTTSPTVPFGYSAGAGAAKVTQGAGRTTGVTVTTVTGQIQTDTASLGAELSAAFAVTATGLVTATDVVVVTQISGSNGGNTDVYVSALAADSFTIKVANNNAAAGTAETGAIIINYVIIKGAIT